MVEVEKPGQLVPESVLKKQKRNEEWALAKKQDAELLKKKNAANRKLIFNRAKQYTKEYEDQVSSFVLCLVFGSAILIDHDFCLVFTFLFILNAAKRANSVEA